jgi:hypothetical protein
LVDPVIAGGALSNRSLMLSVKVAWASIAPPTVGSSASTVTA